MDQTKIWDYFQNWNEVGNTFAGARSRYEFLAHHLAPGMSVLNIGVGRGGLEAILLMKGVLVSCLDPSEKSIEYLREKFSLGNRAQVGFSQLMPFVDNQFDAVVMSEVIEHLNDSVLFDTLTEVLRVLKSNGRFIGTVPANEILLASQVLCPHCGKAFHRWGHIQTFSDSRLRGILAKYFERVTLSRHYFDDINLLNWKGRITFRMKKFMVLLGIEGSGETYYFSAVKR